MFSRWSFLFFVILIFFTSASAQHNILINETFDNDMVASSRHIGPLPVSENRSGIFFSRDTSWVSDDREKRFTYGLNINSPWDKGGTLFMHFPEHLEYNPVGNKILRHYDSIPTPWIISPDGLQASRGLPMPTFHACMPIPTLERLNPEKRQSRRE
jgi:hypothetical protein